MSSELIVWPGGKTYPHTDGIASPIPLLRGSLDRRRGTFWAWPIDGYYDLHFVADADGYGHPDGSDVVSEILHTLTDCKRAAREETAWSRSPWYVA